MRQCATIPFLHLFLISIHAPLTGCDQIVTVIDCLLDRFQSTHPLRDATLHPCLLNCISTNFNPRTPYGMRPKQFYRDAVCRYFNPRTPYGMRLSFQALTCPHLTNFNPRTPYGMRRKQSRTCF